MVSQYFVPISVFFYCILFLWLYATVSRTEGDKMNK